MTAEANESTTLLPDTHLVENAAAEILARGLRAGGSGFSETHNCWTSSAVNELIENFVGRPDVASGLTYEEKLDVQLSAVSDEAKLLFAELTYLCLLPLSNYTSRRKREVVQSALSRIQEPIEIPEHLSDALDGAVFNGGVAFMTRRYWQLSYLIEFAAGFLSDPHSDGVWSDPRAFRDLLDLVTRTNAPSQRFSLLYMAFPDYFLPIVSTTHRKRIVLALQDVLEIPTGDPERDLHDIIRTLESEEGRAVNPYVEPWRSMWDPKLPGPGPDPTKRAWLVRGSSIDGNDLIPTWQAEGYVSLRAATLRPVEPGISRDDLSAIVKEDYSQSSYAAKTAKLDEFHTFLSRMSVGDIVATTSDGMFHVGEITGDPEFHEQPDGLSNLRREVVWNPITSENTNLSKSLKASLQVQNDVVELTLHLARLEELLVIEGGDKTKKPTPGPELDPERPLLRDATEELASALHVDLAWLNECVELLRDRPQLIFYGPPGTGKTYIAQHLAAHLAGDNVRLVQFHPAYSYEDFFEGYRPLESGGFALKPGPFRKTVDAARENPSTPYFLIIDEINRGNLAKIFGELYFLLEYRSQNVDLLYATDDDIGFTLPENVFIIGTMNTADRSIALVDTAMRRRFAFLPLHPSEAPTNGILRRWLEANTLDLAVADLLDELNSRIEDPEFKIGPSYFMRTAVHESGGFERAWRTAIMPLLEEHHYGDGVDVNVRYGLSTIHARVESRRNALELSP